MTQWVYGFASSDAEGHAGLGALLGGKGANLAEMARLGLPVPPGFTITTEACVQYFEQGNAFPEGMEAAVETALSRLETQSNKVFGDIHRPLLVAVRSGARASMPGMMDTVLNLGLNDETVKGLANLTNDPRFAYDCYRRFIAMYGDVVLRVPSYCFDDIIDDLKDRHDYRLDTDLTAEDWQSVVAAFFEVVKDQTGDDFPQDPKVQLWGAIKAVFESWHNERARFYRKMHAIPDDWGTAVNIQSMVFGNMGEGSATGVAFTRDPSTGEKALYGEFLPNAQGEDVVAGLRTPHCITEAARLKLDDKKPSMQTLMPSVYADFEAVAKRLEAHYGDVQDVEFTIEQGQLFMLQTRNAKRTTQAALKIAVAMAREGVITPQQALMRLDPFGLHQLLHPCLDPSVTKSILAKGLPASPGAASGRIVFSAEAAVKAASSGVSVILVRDETSPEDIQGMHAAKAILTARGGMTSHAAVVARGMGRPCVCGVSALQIDYEKSVARLGDVVLHEGDIITLDGGEGEVIKGAVPMIEPKLDGDFEQLMAWADQYKILKVRANADTPEDTKTALRFGAEGIGLCRTEHMFFEENRMAAVREMILADDEAGRRSALSKLKEMQTSDFEALFRLMEHRPVNVRLLDPPLHEFLPHTEADVAAVAEATGIAAEHWLRKAQTLAETNPMLGWRGCRLGIVHPEIYEMQLLALFEAAVAVKQHGFAPMVEIMHPLVGHKAEMDTLSAMTHKIAHAVMQDKGVAFDYQVGTMIELPRAAFVADQLAQTAEYFSFGTNDLTQTTLGISRDDAAKFLNIYRDQGLLASDPFVTLDIEGVGQVMQMAVERGRSSRPGLKLGICGEHGGDPASIAFCHDLGLNYVSCSPYRVPVAKLAAAQAAIRGVTVLS